LRERGSKKLTGLILSYLRIILNSS